MMRIVQGVGWGFSTTASGTIATDLIPPDKRGEGMGYYGLSGNLALAFGPSLGLALVGIISFKLLFFIAAALGILAVLLSSRIHFRKGNPSTVKAVKKDLYEKTALPPSILLFFITATFGGIASFLPIFTAQKGIPGIQWYFFIYAISLMATRTFAGKLYDLKGHKAVFIPGSFLILAAMVLLAWLPSSLVLYIAALLYGIGFGSVQPALQAWSVQKAAANRKGMANATFYSFFDLGVGVGAILFGQVAHMFGYSSIYITAAIFVGIAMLLYLTVLGKSSVQRAL
jgi:predicted MFS family arabinose efflux permease